MIKKALIPLATGCEELEAVTVIDIFRRAGIEVTSACLDDEMSPVTASRGIKILADKALNDALKTDYDIVVLPGGQPGTDNLRKDARILDLVKSMNANDKLVAAICAAPMILAEAGILAGIKATGYPGSLARYTASGIEVEMNKSVVRDGNIITSQGPGTAMDFALELTEIIMGSEKRKEVQEGLQCKC